MLVFQWRIFSWHEACIDQVEQACWGSFSARNVVTFVWMVLYFPQSCHNEDQGCTAWASLSRFTVTESHRSGGGLIERRPAPSSVRGAWKKMAKRPKYSCELGFINCSCNFSFFVYNPAWCCFCDHNAYFIRLQIVCIHLSFGVDSWTCRGSGFALLVCDFSPTLCWLVLYVRLTV